MGLADIDNTQEFYNDRPRSTAELSPYYLNGRQLTWTEVAAAAYVQDSSGWYWQRQVDPITGELGLVPVDPLDQDRLRQLGDPDYDPVPGPGSSGSSQRIQFPSEIELDRAQAQRLRDQTAIDREQLANERANQARQEREARLNALLDNIRYLNEIQPDLARFGAGLNSVPLQGITPTVGYGNALEGNISTLQGQLQNPPPLGTPIPQVVAPQAPGVVPQVAGMREGGSFAANGNITFGSNKLGTLVGEERSGIDGSAEVVVHDKNTGQLIEVIPLAGQAAEGATFDWGSMMDANVAKWDTSTLFGAMSPLYQPFGVSASGNVPTRATARPTDFGYITPKFSTDFAPVQPPAYGALSQQYFDINRGQLLPNPTTIMPQLRALRANDPVGFANVLSLYATATDQQGNPSGLPPEAILQFLDNSALSGRNLGFIGVR